MAPDDPEVEAELLRRLREAPDREAADKLLRLLNRDLRRIAHARLRKLPASHTLRTTALVNEAYVKLFASGCVECADRQHFLARAAHAMRSILVDYARSKDRQRRRPPGNEVPLEEVTNIFEERYGDTLAFDEAMRKLEELDARAAQIVELRFFTDCSVQETADVLEVSKRSVERDWKAARAFLKKELR